MNWFHNILTINTGGRPVNETEKSKRKEKPKGAPRRRWLFAYAIVALIMLAAGMFALLVFPVCACSPFAETSTAIWLTNARVAGQLTETRVASLATAGVYRQMARTASARAIVGWDGTSAPPLEYFLTMTAAANATATGYDVNRQRSMTATMQAAQTAIALLTDVTDGGGLAMITPDFNWTQTAAAVKATGTAQNVN